MGDLERQIRPVHRFSSRKKSNFFCSTGDRGQTFDDLGSKPRMSLMAWSHCLCSEDVEVFLGKYGLESSDAVGQNERFLLCFYGSMGSFCKFLGGHRGGMQVFYSRLQKNSGHEESVPWLIFSFTSPNGGLVKEPLRGDYPLSYWIVLEAKSKFK